VQRLTVPSVATGPNVSQSFYQRDVMQIKEELERIREQVENLE